MSKYFVSYAADVESNNVYDAGTEKDLAVSQLTEDEYASIYASIYGELPEASSPDSNSLSPAPENNADVFSAISRAVAGNFIGEDDSSSVLPDSDFEIDSRFNLSGKPLQHNFEDVFGDISYDEEHVRAEQPQYEELRSSYGENTDYGYDDLQNTSEDNLGKLHFLNRRKKEKFSKKKQNPLPAPDYVSAADEITEDEAGFRSLDEIKNEKMQQELEEIARAYIEAHPEEAFESETDDVRHASDPGSFKDYVVSSAAGMFYRFKGAVPAGTSASTMGEEEDFGEEVSTRQAVKYYGTQITPIKKRCKLACFVVLAMAYVSLGLPIPGMLSYLKVATAAVLAMQFMVMLLGLDVVTTGILNTFRKKFGADSMAVLSCIITSVDAVMLLKTEIPDHHMPLCLLSSICLLGVMIANQLSVRGIRKAVRVPSIGRSVSSVTGETSLKRGEITILKSQRSINGFIRRIEEAAPDEELFIKASPFILIADLLFALIVSLSKGAANDFVYLLSVMMSVSVPFCSLLCFSLPFFIGSNRIFGKGAAIAGWSGACDLGQSRNLVVTDRDLFPEGTVEIKDVRIFADYDSEAVISYCGSMMLAAGCGISSCFGKLMEENGGRMMSVENFEHLAGGGLKGYIDGHSVIVGSVDLMRLENIRIPYRLIEDSSVLVSVDGILYGIFNMKYNADPKVRRALVSLMRSSRHPIFAIKDFNVTPELIHNVFDVATDGYDFPPYIERFNMSSAKPAEESQISAVVCIEGLGPLTMMADTGRGIYLSSRLNILITSASVVLGLLIVLIKFLSAGAVSIGFLLGWTFLWAIPVLLIGTIIITVA